MANVFTDYVLWQPKELGKGSIESFLIEEGHHYTLEEVYQFVSTFESFPMHPANKDRLLNPIKKYIQKRFIELWKT